MRRFCTLFLLSLVCTVAACAQDGLARHGVIGLQVSLSDNSKPAGPGNPVVVGRAFDEGAGALAGIQKGDAIASLDGMPVTSPLLFARTVARRLAGDTVKIVVVRDGQSLQFDAVLKPRPYETSQFSDVLYRSVDVRGAKRRVIVTRPKQAGRLPALLLMQGLGCESLDNLDRAGDYGGVIAAFEQRGFVTMRVEKTGEGDSQGPLCTDREATPDLEAEGYVAGLRALKSFDFVDPQKVFVFAHSMGPVVGSLAIAREPVSGFIAAETVGTSWFEYDLERHRVQIGLHALPDAVDRSASQYEICSHRFYIEKQPAEQLAKIPGCETMIFPFGLVPHTFMQAVADISLGKGWKSANFPVLVIYGTASPVTTARQSRALAELINRFRPGTATYVEIEGMGHDLARWESQRAYLDHAPGPHPFHTGLIEVMMGWLDSQLARS